MQPRTNPSTLHSDSLNDSSSHQIFIIGLGDSGIVTIKEDLLKSAYGSTRFDYEKMRTKKEETIKVIFTNEMADTVASQETYLELKTFDSSKPSHFIFCLDSSGYIKTQLAMLETAIILLNERNYKGEYSIVCGVISISTDADRELINSASESISNLIHANYLTRNKITFDGNIGYYRSNFSSLNNKVHSVCESLLNLQLKPLSESKSADDKKEDFIHFVDAYKRDYELSGWFKMSNFLDDVKNYKITNMAGIRKYAKDHPQSRTSFLLKLHPERSTDIEFTRFINRYEGEFLKPGFFKQSHFRKMVAEGEITSMDYVKLYAEEYPSSRTAKVLKAFK